MAVTWREGTAREDDTRRFLALRVRPANIELRAPRTTPSSDLAVAGCWPSGLDGKDEPTDYWLSNLPAEHRPDAISSRLGKLRWRIEHDYRELKDALGLDHFEGRTYRGWHHHVTLVSRSPTPS